MINVSDCAVWVLVTDAFCFHRSSFDASKSTKGASKLRRDLINTEIGHLRDLLPLPASTRQRLSQLQLMALVCVYVRKSNYFQQGEWRTEKAERLHRTLTDPFNKLKLLWLGRWSGKIIWTTNRGLMNLSGEASARCGTPEQPEVEPAVESQSHWTLTNPFNKLKLLWLGRWSRKITGTTNWGWMNLSGRETLEQPEVGPWPSRKQSVSGLWNCCMKPKKSTVY